MINYMKYEYNRREIFLYGTAGALACFVLLMLFYNQIVFSVLMTIPFTILFLKYYKKILLEKRRWELTVQFKDAMEGMVSALSAGYSLENALRETRKDLKLMYSEEDIILKEFEYMVHRMELRVSVEMLLIELGRRSGVEDIIIFSEILTTARRTGGNLIRVMRQTANNIAEKIEIKREIETLVSGKKMEAGCMTGIPLLMIVYLRVFSPGFLDPLYHNVMGIIIMTIALAVYILSFLWGQQIMKIEF